MIIAVVAVGTWDVREGLINGVIVGGILYSSLLVINKINEVKLTLKNMEAVAVQPEAAIPSHIHSPIPQPAPILEQQYIPPPIPQPVPIPRPAPIPQPAPILKPVPIPQPVPIPKPEMQVVEEEPEQIVPSGLLKKLQANRSILTKAERKLLYELLGEK